MLMTLFADRRHDGPAAALALHCFRRIRQRFGRGDGAGCRPGAPSFAGAQAFTEAWETGNEKYVSGNGSSASRKCHHSHS